MTLQYCFDGSAKKVNNPSVSSPRTWGCFQPPQVKAFLLSVFPTHVGVFLCRMSYCFMLLSLPHARGGVSISSFMLDPWLRVFPTHVGVFPGRRNAARRWRRLPHARGGVSHGLYFLRNHHRSSPRTWGCFSTRQIFDYLAWVFPTHVGVFPSNIRMASGVMRLPHARGGVSPSGMSEAVATVSSPRTWGGFSHESCGRRHKLVFPTHVGCF